MLSERLVRRLLIFVSLIGLAAGAGAAAIGHPDAAHAIWAAATLPVALALALSIARDLAAGRLGVDVIALLAMSAASESPDVLKQHAQRHHSRQIRHRPQRGCAGSLSRYIPLLAPKS